MPFLEDIPKIIKENRQLLEYVENIIKNLIIITEFVSVLKSKRTAFAFLEFAGKTSNYLLNQDIDPNYKNWIFILLKNFLTHLHFEYNRIELNLFVALNLIQTISNCLLVSKKNEIISMLISICIFIFYFYFLHF